MKPKQTRTTWCSAIALSLMTLLMVTLTPAIAAADTDPSSRVARLNYVRGSVSFQPAGEPDWVSAIVNRPITTGDRLWADENSRAEMHLGSSTIRLDEQTGMSFLNLDDRITQIELSEGVLNVRVLRLDRDEIFEIDTPNQAFTIERPGEYRIEASEDGYVTMVTVRSGEGEVTGGGRSYSVGKGKTGRFVGDDRLRADIYKAGGFDDFDDWCQDRNRRDDNAISVRYVSREVVGYQDLDDYGHWQLVSGYGYVWFPRVSSSWAPYHDGHWVWISPWGWTWVDDAPWGYAPFHYGRWVVVRNNWAWIPGPIAVRPVYAPALVVFVGGPRFNLSVSFGGGGYVGWFPLGPREVYVPSYRTSREYVQRVNISNTTVNNITITNVYNNTSNKNIHYVNKTAPGGVTAVSQTTFINAHHVGKSTVVVNPKEIASAPVQRRAEVAPTRSSVLGPTASANNRASQPRSEVFNRAVVAKTQPPAPPVSFERQQAKLAAQPGQPLAATDIESLRPSRTEPGRTHVKQAPPGKPAIADSDQVPSDLPVRGRASGRPSDNDGSNTVLNNGTDGRNGNRGAMSAPTQTVAPAGPPTVVTAPAQDTPGRGNNRPPSSNRGPSAGPTQTVAPAGPPTVVTAPAQQTPGQSSSRPPSSNRGPSSAPAQTVAPAGPPTVVTAPAQETPGRGNNRPPSSNRAPSAGPAQTVAPAGPPTVVTAPAQDTPGKGSNRPPSSNRGPSSAPAQTVAPAGPPTVVTAPSQDAPGRSNNRSSTANRGSSSGSTQTVAPAAPPTVVAPPVQSSPSRGNGPQEARPSPSPSNAQTQAAAPPAGSSQASSAAGSRGGNRGRQAAPAPPPAKTTETTETKESPSDSSSTPARGESRGQPDK